MHTIRELEQQEKYKNMLKRKNKEIKRLNNIIKQYDKVSFIHEMELQKRIDKALYWISENTHYTSLKADKLIQDDNTNLLELLDILKGE